MIYPCLKKYLVYGCFTIMVVICSSCNDVEQSQATGKSDTHTNASGHVDDSAKSMINKANQKIKDTASGPE